MIKVVFQAAEFLSWDNFEVGFSLVVKDIHVFFVAATQKWEDSLDLRVLQNHWQIELNEVIVFFSVKLEDMVQNQFD